MAKVRQFKPKAKRVGKRLYKRKSTMKPTKSLKKIITKTVKNYFKVETKRQYVEPTSANFNTQTSNSFSVLPNITQTNFYQLCPQITLGTDSQTRNGNQISPKGLYVKGHIYGDWLNIVANNSSFQTIYVRILCCSDKIYPTDSIAYGAANSQLLGLLQKGATSTNFLFSDQCSLYRPINTDRYTVYYDKVIKLGMYSANIGTSNVDQTNGLRRFQFKVPMKEAWKYDDTSGRPSNVAMPFLLVGYCPGDNRNITSGATTSFVKLSYYTDFYYTDM